MPPKKTYYPAKTFDDDLAAFVDMCAKNKWEFPGITLADLQKAVAEQRAERAVHDALELQFLNTHEDFGVSQADRHALFSSALNAARGVFRNNKAILAQLQRFTAQRSPRKKTPVEPPPKT